MNKLLSFIKRNLQISVTALALACLALSNTYFMVQAQEGEVAQEESVDEVKSPLKPEEQVSNLAPAPYDPSLFPHANCVQKIAQTEEPSSTFNPNVPYNLSFYRTGNPSAVFQDVNGDNLPDYVWAYSIFDSGIQTYEGCVYLNNGNGWTKAYECYAVTHVDLNNENITLAKYYGDCAG